MAAELRLLEPNESDAAAIAELVNQHARSVFGESELTEAEIRHWLTLPNLWFRVAERDGAVVGYLDVQDEQALGTRFDTDARALDAETAAALVGAAEEYAGARAAPEAVVRGWAASQDRVLADAYRHAGFRVIRHSFQMRIELDGEPPEPEWADGVTVRTMRPGEEERVHEANEDAFQDHWDHRRTPFDEWRRFSLDHPRFDRSLWFLAVDGDEIAGMSLCAWHFSGDPAFGWVESLGVRPAWRRRGLGLALLRQSFREFHRRGATRVGLGVDAQNPTGAVRLYERAGMHVVRRTETWEKAL